MRTKTRKRMPVGRRPVYASYVLTDTAAIHGVDALLMANAAETMRNLAAKKGRVLIAPSFVVEARGETLRAATVVVVRALTGPRPDWKRARP
jgi:hypothetical protein